jgi:hypothetical protein
LIARIEELARAKEAAREQFDVARSKALSDFEAKQYQHKRQHSSSTTIPGN